MLKKLLLILPLACSIVLFNSSCKKSDPTPSNNSTNNGSVGTSQAIIITTGSQVLGIGQKLKFNANFIDASGNTTAATGITWTSSNTSYASFSSNELSALTEGQSVITASATVDGKTIESSVIIGIASATQTTLFTVSPQAVIWTTNAGTIPLFPVYFGTAAATYTYTSSDPSIITVSASGEITFLKAGNAYISVKATALTGTPTVNVPVLVLGTLTTASPLVVSRIALTPQSNILFKAQTAQLSATAYDQNGGVVSGQTAFWEVVNDTNNFKTNAVTIDQTGVVTAHSVGSAIAYATIKGIKAQASIQVYPDSVLIVTPYNVSVDANTTKQFTATLYKIDRSTKTLLNTPLTTPSNIKWEVPTIPSEIPGASIFNIASISTSGLVTISANASPGIGTAVLAYIPGTDVGGGALLTINIPGAPVIDSGNFTMPGTGGGMNTTTGPGDMNTFPGSGFPDPGRTGF